MRLNVVLSTLEGCAKIAEAGRVLTAAFCAALHVASTHAAASGFDVNGSASRLWFGAGSGLLVQGPPGHTLRAWARVDGLVPFRREGFDVRGVGDVFSPPSFAGSLSVGAAFLLW